MGDLSNGGMILEWETLIHPYDLCNFSDQGRGWSSRKVGKKGYLLKGCRRGVFINSSEMVDFLQEKCKNNSNPEYSFKEIDCC